jgi:glycosyltransferase involved in cell wall biosynthesis
MKIGLITEYPPFEAGMISRVYLAKALGRHSPVEVLAWNNATKLAKILAPLRRIWQLFKFFRRNDVVQVEYEPAGYMFLFLPTICVLKLIAPVKLALRVHETLEERKLFPAYWLFHEIFCSCTDAILVHNSHHKRLFSRRLQQRTIVLEHAVIAREEQRAPIPGTILMLGFIHPRKGYEIAIEAMRLAADAIPSARLVIAGKCQNSEYLESLKALIGQYGLQDRVTIDDRYLPEEEVENLLRTCEIMLLPYKRVTMSGILTHIVSYRIPALVADYPQLREFLSNRLDYFPIDNPKVLSTKLVDVLENDDLKARMEDELADLQTTFCWETVGYVNYEILHHLSRGQSISGFVLNPGVQLQLKLLSPLPRTITQSVSVSEADFHPSVAAQRL